MAEGTPFTPEEIRRLNRDLMEKIIDRAASDPEWKQRLLDGPEAAIAEAGFPEVRQLQEVQASVQALHEAEVAGQEIPQNACYRHGRNCSVSIMVDNTWV
jgi:hypothetical protein